MRNLAEIISDINVILEDQLVSTENYLFKGLATLQPLDGKTFPMIRISDKEAEKISPLDSKGLIFYHRVISELNEPVPGKGASNYQMVTYSMRLIGVGYRPNIVSATTWNNEDRAREVLKVLGNNVRLSGGELVMARGQTVTDKLTVLNTEYAGNDTFKHKVLELFAFSIDYTIRARVICITTIPVPPTPITAFSYSNNAQSVESADFVTMVPSTTPSVGTFNYYVDANDTLPTGLTLNEDTGYITRTGTIADGSYSFDVILVGSGLASGVASVAVTLTVAAVGPVLSNPTDTSTGSTTGSGTVDTNTGNGTLYWVVTQSATSPSAAQVQAGQDHTGSTADDSGSQAVSATGTQNVSFTGLVSGTTYYAHFVQVDEETDESNVSSADGFTDATLLIDLYPGAHVAYSISKLNSSYLGSCIRVRRGSDDAEMDIGFVNNYLDVKSLLDFAGVYDVFVTKRYDQSGNGFDQVQTTKLDQPKIVGGGILFIIGELPAVFFDGVGYWMEYVYSSSLAQPATYFLYSETLTQLTTNAFYGSSNNSNRHQLSENGSQYVINAGSSVLTGVPDNLNPTLITSLFNSTSSVIRRDGTQIGSGDAGTNASTSIRTATNGTQSVYSAHNEQTLVIYDSDQTSNFAAIETIISDLMAASLSIYPFLESANIVCDGNSLTLGTGGTAYPVRLAAFYPTVINDTTINNVAIGGQTTQEMIDNASDVDALLDGGATNNILIAWEITNHLLLNITTTTAQNAFQEYCEDRTAAGWNKIIVITNTPRNLSNGTWTMTQVNDRLDTTNTWLRANYTDFANALVDIQAAPEMVRSDSTEGNPPNATYYSDTTHYTSSGYLVLARLINIALINL
jgi:hypothetical protein